MNPSSNYSFDLFQAYQPPPPPPIHSDDPTSIPPEPEPTNPTEELRAGTETEPVQNGASPKPANQIQAQSRAQASRSSSVTPAKLHEEVERCGLIQQEIRRWKGSSRIPKSMREFSIALETIFSTTSTPLTPTKIVYHLNHDSCCKAMISLGHQACKQVWDECFGSKSSRSGSQKTRQPSPKNPTKQKQARTGTEPVQTGASFSVPLPAMVPPPPLPAMVPPPPLLSAMPLQPPQHLNRLLSTTCGRQINAEKPKQVAQASPMPMGMTAEAQKKELVVTIPSLPKHSFWTPGSHQQQQPKQWMEFDDPFGVCVPSSSMPAPDLDASNADGRARLTGSLDFDDDLPAIPPEPARTNPTEELQAGSRTEPALSEASPKPANQTQTQPRARVVRLLKVSERKPHPETKTCLLIQKEIKQMSASSKQFESKTAFARALLKNLASRGQKLKVGTILIHFRGSRCNVVVKRGGRNCKQVLENCLGIQTQTRKKVSERKPRPQVETCLLVQREIKHMSASSKQFKSKAAVARALLKNLDSRGQKLKVATIRNHLNGCNCNAMVKKGGRNCKQVFENCLGIQTQTRKSHGHRQPSPKNPTKQKRARTGTEPVQSGASFSVPIPAMVPPSPLLPAMPLQPPQHLNPLLLTSCGRQMNAEKPKQVAQASPMPMGMTAEAQKKKPVETIPSPPKHSFWTPGLHQQQHSKQWVEAQDPSGGYDPSSSPAPDLDVLQTEGRAHLTGSLNLDDGDDLQPDAYDRDYPFL